MASFIKGRVKQACFNLYDGSTKMINALKKLVFCILWQNFINQQSGLDFNHGCGEVLAEIIRTLDSTGYETPVKQSFLSKCRRELL